MAVQSANRTSGEREFRLSEDNFQVIAKLIYAQAGIVMDKSKKELVYSRLARRLRKLELADFRSYLEFLESPAAGNELENLTNALTTNHTKFFREDHHFDFVKNVIVPAWVERARKTGDKKLRIWSSASSSGEEPYTLAMVLSEALDTSWDWRILGTDIDTKVIATAKEGVYSDAAFRDIPKQYHSYVSSLPGGKCRMAQSLRNRITFNHLNLHGPWPMKGMFDLILCRNVVIYFDAPSKEKLMHRFCERMKPGSWFFLGHSESLLDSTAPLKLVGKTIYQLRDEGTIK